MIKEQSELKFYDESIFDVKNGVFKKHLLDGRGFFTLPSGGLFLTEPFFNAIQKQHLGGLCEVKIGEAI